LCHWGVFQPQAGTGELSLGDVPLRRRQRAPGSRNHAAFRRRFLPRIEKLLGKVLGAAREMGVSALGLSQFLPRGLNNLCVEWGLAAMAWNMKRMFVLAGAI